MSGRFLKVGNEYRIGINNHSTFPVQLLIFFHGYGHAVYRREANEEIIDEPSLIRTETAALLSSLKLADQEGLPSIAFSAVKGARLLAQNDKVYRFAMDNLSGNPLWQKYAKVD